MVVDPTVKERYVQCEEANICHIILIVFWGKFTLLEIIVSKFEIAHFELDHRTRVRKDGLGHD